MSKQTLTCRQIMRRPVETVQDDDSVFVAARIMRERGVGFLPVCDRAGVVVGILTDRDITVRVAAEDHRTTSTSVREVMTSAVVSCGVDAPVANAEREMRGHRITRVVVVDADGRPAGILSLTDVASYASAGELARTVRAVAERKYEPERP